MELSFIFADVMVTKEDVLTPRARRLMWGEGLGVTLLSPHRTHPRTWLEGIELGTVFVFQVLLTFHSFREEKVGR